MKIHSLFSTRILVSALLLTLATVAAVLTLRRNPLWWIAGGAILGLVGAV